MERRCKKGPCKGQEEKVTRAGMICMPIPHDPVRGRFRKSAQNVLFVTVESSPWMQMEAVK